MSFAMVAFAYKEPRWKIAAMQAMSMDKYAPSIRISRQRRNASAGLLSKIPQLPMVVAREIAEIAARMRAKALWATLRARIKQYNIGKYWNREAIRSTTTYEERWSAPIGRPIAPRQMYFATGLRGRPYSLYAE